MIGFLTSKETIMAKNKFEEQNQDAELDNTKAEPAADEAVKPVEGAAVSFSTNPKVNPNPDSIKAVENAVKHGIAENVARILAVRSQGNCTALLALK